MIVRDYYESTIRDRNSLVFSNSIANVAANTVGVAKTGSAIGLRHGAAHTSSNSSLNRVGKYETWDVRDGCFSC
jgi:hypothetical protein